MLEDHRPEKITTTEVPSITRIIPKRLNIGISENLNQWHCLLNICFLAEFIEKHTRFRNIAISIFKLKDANDLVRIHDRIVVSNYDVIIWHEDFPNKRDTDLIIPRFAKSEQQRMVFDASRSIPGFTALETYSVNLGNARRYDARTIPCLDKKRWIVRPEHGARSIGQLIVDTKEVDMALVLNSLSPELFSGEHLIPGVIAHTGDESFENESVEILKEGLFIQEVVENVAEEYRVIMGPNGEVETISTRERKPVNASYSAVDASSKDRLIYVRGLSDPGANFLDQEGLAEFPLARSLLCLPVSYNSVDVFKRTDGTWGIFEFCNQFATFDIPVDVSSQMITGWLMDHLVKVGY